MRMGRELRLVEARYAPLMTAACMIGTPLVLAFLAGAGAGTIFAPVAVFAGTLWSIFGGVSLIAGLILLGWTVWSAWRAGDLGQRKLHG